MKKAYLLLVIPLVLTGLNFSQAGWYGTGDDSLRVLTPEEIHYKESAIIAGILSRYHYGKISLNDSMSSAIFDKYLSVLDYSKLYLLKSDVEQFEKERYKIDDYLKEGKIETMYEFFSVFSNRLNDRLDAIDTQLDTTFDFSVDEYYNADRESAKWSETNEELNEEWRKMLKSQVLSLKLTGKTEEEASDILRKRYKRYKSEIKKYKSEDVFQLFMNAVSESFDPHTNYFSPASADNFNIQMSRSLEGIGAQLRTLNDYTTVAGIVAGGPAFKSNQLFKDDKIVGVAQGEEGEMEDVIGWRIDEVVKLIRGPKGSKVRLLIISASEGANALPHEIVLVREKINLEDQRAEKKVVPIEKDGAVYHFGVIELPSFYMDYQAYLDGNLDYNSTTRDVKNIIIELEEEGVDGILLDLRRNGGGSLAEAISLTGLFIEDGPVVQVKSMDGKVDVESDPDPLIVYNGPLAVLTSRFSASASEIFAGAIQDYERGLVIGDQTYGKGTVQNLLELSRWLDPSEKDKSGQLKMTMAKYYRITGNSTQNTGVTPDIQIPSAFDPKETGESAEPAALPWDRIGSATFEKTGNISKEMVEELNDRYQRILQSDEILQDLLAEIAEMKSNMNDTRISLNEDMRKKERVNQSNEMSGNVNTSEISEAEVTQEIEDPYIYSGVNILAELVKLNKK